jgi:hypothetical protein
VNENLANFKSWYADILTELYSNREAGFVILIVAFPLLERYLREKSKVQDKNTLNHASYQELLRLFPELINKEKAGQFWQVYRNGLLHQITTCKTNRNGCQLPFGRVSNDCETIKIDASGAFWLHPAKFAKRIVDIIEADFATFDGCHRVNHSLPVIQSFDLFLGTGAPEGIAFNMPNPLKK